MKNESSTKSTLHGTFVPLFEVDLTDTKSIQKLSIPQKRALLRYYAETSSIDEVSQLIPVDTERLESELAKKDVQSVTQQGDEKQSIEKKDHVQDVNPQKIREKLRRVLFCQAAHNEILKMPVNVLDRKITALDISKLPGNTGKDIGDVMENQAIVVFPTPTPSPPSFHSLLGYVLYEKLTYTDKGIVKSDDVVGQFVLPPGGEVEVATKSWSKVTVDFEENLSQMTEEESESALSQNREISEATSKQQQYSMSLSASYQGQGNVGIFKAGTSVSSSLSAALDITRQQSTKEKQDITNKAASRARREHKITMKRATEFGREVVRTEKFRNNNKFQPVSYKFFKAVKEWEIRHEVYDVALCLDVMVKNPGLNLRKMLQEKFNPETVPEFNELYLPDGIEAMPKPYDQLVQRIQCDKSEGYATPFVFIIPEGYQLIDVFGSGDKGPICFEDKENNHDHHGHRIMAGRLSMHQNNPRIRGGGVLNYMNASGWEHDHNGPTSTVVTITANIQRTDALLKAWKSYARNEHKEIYKKAWQLEQDISEATRRAFNEKRNTPVGQILRQEERNELASAVAMTLTGNYVPTPIQDPTKSLFNHNQIRKIHDSLEWHNASCFLYPYWWDPPVFVMTDVKDILEIDHDDSLRRAFLQASWARVLVPVRQDAELFLLCKMYGPDVQKYIEMKLENNSFDPPHFKEIVEAYVNLHNERTKGRLQQQQNLVDSNEPMSDSDMQQPEPIVLATWKEYTPTDETFAEMQILQDDSGNPVNLGEPSAQETETLHLKRSAALVEMLGEVKDKVDGVTLSFDVMDAARATIDSKKG